MTTRNAPTESQERTGDKGTQPQTHRGSWLRRASDWLPGLVVFLIGVVTVGYYQLTSEFPFAYDPYWFLGVARTTLDSGSVTFLEMYPPYATVTTIVPMGYVPMESMPLAAVWGATGLSPVTLQKAHTALVAGILMVLVYALARRITQSWLPGVIAAVVLMCAPYVFVRLNFFVPENVGFAAFLSIALLIVSNRSRPEIMAVLLIGGLAFHPRSFILFGPLLVLLWLMQHAPAHGWAELFRRTLDRRNLVIAGAFLVVSVPFLIPLWINLYALLATGATYTLAISREGAVASWSELDRLMTPFVIVAAVPGAAITLKDWRKVGAGQKFLVIWWAATWGILLAAPLRNLAVYRFVFYAAFPTALLIAVLAQWLIRLGSPKSTGKHRTRRASAARVAVPAIVAIGLVAPAVVGLGSSPLLIPWVAWGPNERDAMSFLTSATYGRDDFVVFTPEFGLPFAYGIKHVEMREVTITQLLDGTTSPADLACRLSVQYPGATSFFVVFTYITRDVFASAYPVFGSFDPQQADFGSPTVWVYELPRC